MEIWKPVTEPYHDHYEVSNHGRVRRASPAQRTHPGRILKPRLNTYGYEYVSLYAHGKHRNFTIHRLVALAFLGEPLPATMTVNHMDGDKANNIATNLEWVTRGDNIRHAALNGLIPVGEKAHASKLTRTQVESILAEPQDVTNTALSQKYGVSDVAISKIRRRLTWKHVQPTDN